LCVGAVYHAVAQSGTACEEADRKRDPAQLSDRAPYAARLVNVLLREANQR